MLAGHPEQDGAVNGASRFPWHCVETSANQWSEGSSSTRVRDTLSWKIH